MAVTFFWLATVMAAVATLFCGLAAAVSACAKLAVGRSSWPFWAAMAVVYALMTLASGASWYAAVVLHW